MWSCQVVTYQHDMQREISFFFDFFKLKTDLKIILLILRSGQSVYFTRFCYFYFLIVGKRYWIFWKFFEISKFFRDTVLRWLERFASWCTNLSERSAVPERERPQFTIFMWKNNKFHQWISFSTIFAKEKYSKLKLFNYNPLRYLLGKEFLKGFF